jgi:L-Ala-D/L-Glu epimerase
MITYYKYRLPFSDPFTNANKTYDYREGILFRYTNDDVDIVSEAAPLPGFSDEKLATVKNVLSNSSVDSNEFLNHVSSVKMALQYFQENHFPPSVSFALSCIALDLIEARNAEELHKLKLSHASKNLTINGVIGSLEIDGDIQLIQKLYQHGYRTIKLKISSQPQRLAQLIKNASDQFPGLKFRIDANQSWDIEGVADHLESFKDLPVEYCEEPCRFDTIEQISEINKHSPVPIALDESIGNIHQLKEILRSGPVGFVIIKPTLLGNLFELIETISNENTHNIKRICTTTLESGVGRTSVCKLAAIIGSDDLAHGLSTGTLFKTDLTNSPEIRNGSMKVNSDSRWCSQFSKCNPDLINVIDL